MLPGEKPSVSYEKTTDNAVLHSQQAHHWG